MHEYRLSESTLQPKQNHSMRLDDWVLCRIYKKKSTMVRTCELVTITNSEANELQQQKFPRPCSLNNLWGFDYMGSISQLLDANYSNNMAFMNQETLMGSFSLADEKYQSGQVQQQNVNVKFQVNQTLFVTPTYEF